MMFTSITGPGNAIAGNDLAAIAAIVKKVDFNQAGLAGTTPLLLAIRQLEKTPTQLDGLRVLLEAGADPNASNGSELPLIAASWVRRQAGPEPIRMLLKAGAHPNQRDEWGTPAYFSASTDAEVLRLMLDAGADHSGSLD